MSRRALFGTVAALLVAGIATASVLAQKKQANPSADTPPGIDRSRDVCRRMLLVH